MKPLLRLMPDQTETGRKPAIDPIIARLHERLSNNLYADSSEVRISLLAEMIWQIYLNTTNRTHRRTP